MLDVLLTWWQACCQLYPLLLSLCQHAWGKVAAQGLTWITMALRAVATSTSLAEVMYRSRRSLFSSWLVASRSKMACSVHLCVWQEQSRLSEIL